MITHSAILAALAELRTTAEAAARVKPGKWTATPTHDGIEWEGHSHVFAVEHYETEEVEGTRTRGVAHLIADSLDIKRSSFADPAPAPAIAAAHIAAWDPAHSLRWLSWAEQVAAEHKPIVENVEWWDCHDGTGKAAICAACANRDPNEYDLGVGNYGVKPDDWVSAYVLWPCSTLTGLATALGLEET